MLNGRAEPFTVGTSTTEAAGQGSRIRLKVRLNSLFAAIRRDAATRLLRMRAFRGRILDPHGEGAAEPRVSNHEARYNPGPERHM
jgi:hypothetical protein